MVKVVEEILKWSVRGDNVKFYVKWKDQPAAENSWESESDLDCKDLIEQFRKDRKTKRRTMPFKFGSPDSSTNGSPGDNAKRAKAEHEQPSCSTRFARGLEAEEIIAPDRSTVVPPGDNAKRAKRPKTEDKKSSGSTGVTRALEAEEIIAPDRSTVVPPGDNAKRAKTQNDKPSGSTGFARDLEAEKILGLIERGGRKMLLIKFRNVEQPETVLASLAHKWIPQMVIDYYESCIEWV